MGYDEGIGSFGDVIFEANSDVVKTLDEFRQTTKAVFVDHEVVGGKPSSEFTGMALDEVSFTMPLNATLGVSPEAEVEVLRAMAKTGDGYLLLLGGTPYGYFTIREIGNVAKYFLRGTIMVADVELSLTEYDEKATGDGIESNNRAAGRRNSLKVPGAKPALTNSPIYEEEPE